MTLTIKNVEPRFLSTFKAFSKCFNAKVEAKKTREEIISEWEKEGDKLVEDFKAGKIKGFRDIKEMHKEIFEND